MFTKQVFSIRSNSIRHTLCFTKLSICNIPLIETTLCQTALIESALFQTYQSFQTGPKLPRIEFLLISKERGLQ